MTAEQKSAEYYRLAYQCEAFKSQRACNQAYCGNCQFNVSLYTADAREAVLIKTSAAIDFAKAKQYESQDNMRNIIWGIVTIVLIVWAVSSFKSCTAPKKTALFPMASDPPTQSIPIPVQEQAVIDRAVRAVKETVFDINGDGLVNCIDYAIMFCMLHPQSTIVLNKNPHTGMNHLFNGIQTSIGYIHIDPQNGKTMEETWGSKYDQRYNENRTRYYIMELMLADFFVGPSNIPEHEATRKQALQMLRDRMDGR